MQCFYILPMFIILKQTKCVYKHNKNGIYLFSGVCQISLINLYFWMLLILMDDV
jgi:hypothetical protein